MAESIIDQFVVLITLQSEGFTKGQKDIEDSSKNLRDSTKKTFSGIEQQGKTAAEGIKALSTEVIGLGLAFLGAKSMVGFVSGMLTTSAAADRVGQTLGMATGKVVAWRQAMGTVGGQEGDADASLKTVEKAMQDYQHFGSTGNDALWMSMGINKSDLQGSDPSAILEKLAGQRNNFSGPDFANRLQQLGLPDGMVNFLMQGGGAVRGTLDKYGTPEMIKAYQEQAKSAEKLQASMSLLESTIANKLVGPVTTISDGLNALLGLTPSLKNTNKDDHVAAGDPDAHWYSPLLTVYAGKGNGSRADRNNNPGNIMTGNKYNHYDSMEAGYAAMAHQIGIDYSKHGSKTISALINGNDHPWSSENAPGNTHEGTMNYIAHVAKAMGVSPTANIDMKDPTTVKKLMVAMYEFESGHRAGSGAADIARAHNHFAKARPPQDLAKLAGKTIEGRKVILVTNHVTVHTQAKDPHAVARAVHHTLKHRVMVAQSDTGVRS